MNPFAFPSETTLRFALLVILALCGSAGQLGDLWDAVHRQGETVRDACVANIVTQVLHLRSIPGGTDDFARTMKAETLPALSGCSRMLRPRAIWQIAGIFATAGATACLYWLIPILILRFARLQPVTADEPPQLQAEVPGRARLTTALVRRGFVASLGIAVAFGLSVKIRDAFAAWHELAALQATAEHGDSDAQNRLGSMYFAGRSVPQDTAQAVLWIRKAAAGGNAEAENTLGFMYSNGEGLPRDDALAVGWFRKAAEKGNPNAQNLGLAYHWGRGLPPDDAVALQWFRRAAELGLAAAQDNLGMMYRLGLGTPHDDGAAINWLRKAADQGYAEAQYNLGQIYEQGGVAAEDDAQAMVWFRKAADLGYTMATQHLQAMCEHGTRPACQQ